MYMWKPHGYKQRMHKIIQYYVLSDTQTLLKLGLSRRHALDMNGCAQCTITYYPIYPTDTYPKQCVRGRIGIWYIRFVKSAMYTYFFQTTAKASRAHDLPMQNGQDYVYVKWEYCSICRKKSTILNHHTVGNLQTIKQQLSIGCQMTQFETPS